MGSQFLAPIIKARFLVCGTPYPTAFNTPDQVLNPEHEALSRMAGDYSAIIFQNRNDVPDDAMIAKIKIVGIDSVFN